MTDNTQEYIDRIESENRELKRKLNLCRNTLADVASVLWIIEPRDQPTRKLVITTIKYTSIDTSATKIASWKDIS